MSKIALKGERTKTKSRLHILRRAETGRQGGGTETKDYFRILSCAFLPPAAFLVLVYLCLRFSPYPELDAFINRPYSVRYYDRNGILLQVTPLADAGGRRGLRREKADGIPETVKEVFVFAEDRRFYDHFGVDVLALARALAQNLSGGRRVSGASTITMQLARLAAEYSPPPNARAGLGRKITEALNALRLETRLSKNEILELYLNSLPFGFNTEGAASAGKTFFSSSLAMLSPAQIFCLAVIPRRPSLYNPLENPLVCTSAASDLQQRFSKNKRLASAWPLLAGINEEDWKYAASSARRFSYPFELPHLIRKIEAEARLVSAGAGSPTGARPDGAHSEAASAGTPATPKTGAPGGIAPRGEVHLSVDLGLQHFLEKAIAGNVARYYSSRLTNGAALVIDNESGEILAWVGSADYRNEEAAGQIDGVLALNQPGSSMKPFLYAMALEKGFRPTDVLADIPMRFGETEVYLPRNFNNRFNGPMLFRSALASSLNIPAVYLLYRLGVQNYAGELLSLGFDSIRQSSESSGLGLALGNAPVSLEELVRAFSVFPRDGVYIPITALRARAEHAEPAPVAAAENAGAENRRRGSNAGSNADEKIYPSAGSNIAGSGGPNAGSSAGPNSYRVYTADTARLICSFLSDPGARVLAFGSARNFRTGFPSIFKTGTANQYQSIVALGATPKYTAGVWMGNFTGETVMGKTGSSVPAAIVKDTLVFLQGRSALPFSAPENWHLEKVCAVSGMRPGAACLSVISEYIQNGEESRTCTWHEFIDGRSSVSYPAEYQSWFSQTTRQGSLDYGSRPLEIVSPREGFAYLTSPGIGRDEIPVEVIGGSGDELTVTHNGSRFSVKRPFVFYLEKTPGFHTLRVRCGDEEEEISFTVES